MTAPATFAALVDAIAEPGADEEIPVRYEVDLPTEGRPRGITFALDAVFRVRRDMEMGDKRRSVSRRINVIVDGIRGLESDLMESGDLTPWDGVKIRTCSR